MSGLEVAALVGLAAGAVGVGHNRRETAIAEEKEAVAIYGRLFGANLLDCSPDRPSTLAPTLPAGLDSHAASCIQIIEAYQAKRKAVLPVVNLTRTQDYVGDTRTRVLEEFKQWLLTVSGDSLPAIEVISTRLEYCRQLLLRPSVFGGLNETTFMKCIAQVCKQMEYLLHLAASGQKTAERMLIRLHNLGRDLLEASLPVFLFAISASSPWTELPVASVVMSTAVEADNAWWQSELGAVLRAALATNTVKGLLADRSAASVGEQETREFAERLANVRFLWQSERGSSTSSSQASSGLLHAFENAGSHQVASASSSSSASSVSSAGLTARMCCLDLLEHLERVAYFLWVLQRYQLIASTTGDFGLCRLYPSLRHLLQELKGALAQHRQSRLDLMQVVKGHLRRLAASEASRTRAQEKWMQGLRHINEAHLDELYREMMTSCAEVLAAASAANAAQLQIALHQGLTDIASAFNSAEFQARCRMALPDGLLSELRTLPALATTGATANAIASSSTPAPALALTSTTS